MSDIRFQIVVSTSSSILNGYESDIKKKELKNGCLLQETIEKMCANFVKNLKFAVFRDWFSTFLEKYHPNEKGVINVVELFFKSQENSSMLDSQSKNESTAMFIDLLYDAIDKAQKNSIPYKIQVKPSTSESEIKPRESYLQDNQLSFSEEVFSILNDEIWPKIQEKFKLLHEELILENSDGLINEIFGLFSVLNDKLVIYLRKYSEDFFESDIFRKKFSQYYMRKSRLISGLWFQKPQIKMEIHKIDKFNANNLSPTKLPQRERILTSVNQPKNYKDYDVAQSCISKSMNISNEKL